MKGNADQGARDASAGNGHDDWQASDFLGGGPPLSREQAQRVRAALPVVSPWRGLAVQFVAGVCVAVAWFAVTGRVSAAWSALYGMAACVVPGWLFARGWSRGLSGATLQNPGALLIGFMFWEVVKMGFAVAMLVAAPGIVPQLEWPALLVALVVCLKVGWLGLYRAQPARKR